MQRSFTIGARVIAGVATGATLLLAADVQGDVEAAFSSESLYSYRVTHVPDHDQRRFGLPNDGAVHCAPTAAMNWMCYFSNHGQPGIPPGPANWMNPANYDAATAAIGLMGTLMLTAPPGGTSGYWCAFGLRAWLHDYPVLVLRTHLDMDSTPRLRQAASLGMGGGYVMVGVGWYLESGLVIERDGGHALTLTRAARSGSDQEIGWRDPGSHEGDLASQSPFSTETYAVEETFVLPIQYLFPRTMSKIVGYGGNGRQGYIDSLTVILPLFSLTTIPDLSALIRHEVLSFAGTDIEIPPEYYFPAEATMVDMDFHPDGKVMAVLEDAAGAARLYCIDLLTGEVVPCDDGMGLVDPKQVTVGRLRDIFVLDGNDIVRIRADQDPPQTWRRPLPAPVSGMVYDGAGDNVLLLSPETREILLYAYHLDIGPVPFSIPVDVPIGENPKICWNVFDGSGWLVSEASNSLWRMEVVPGVGVVAEEISHPALMAPADDIQAGDFGRIVVSVAGEVLEFMPDATGAWDLVPDPWFADMQTFGGPLLVPRSQTNYQEDEHGTDEFRHVLPDQFSDPELDCDADVIENGVVDVADLVAVILAWGQTGHGGFIRADVNQDGVVDVSDLVDVITAWGPCP